MEGFFDDILDTLRKNGRVEELRQIARENDFKFKTREKFAEQDYLLKAFSIFKGKKDKRLKGIVWKDEPSIVAKIRMYDYWYFGDFKKRKTTVFEIFGEALDFPRFEIHPKGFLSQMTDYLWDKEKPYPNEKEFHAKYQIQSADADLFETEIPPKALAHLLSRKNISVEGEGDYLLLYTNYELTPAKYLMEEYEYVLDFLEIILTDDSNKYV